MNKEEDNQRADNKQQPMKYQQFVPPQGPGPGRPQGPQGPGPSRPQGPQGPGPSRPQTPQGPGPGRPQGPQGPGPGRPSGPQGPGPGRPSGPQGQPPSAPPSFTPQLPREGEQQLSGPLDFRGPFGGRIIDQRRAPRNLRGCLNRFTFIWLINGNNFWFYPVFIDRNTIEGFRWRRNRWEYDRIRINRILFHLCF